MEDMTMPGCSNADEEIDNLLRHFEENNPTLDFFALSETGHDGMVDNTLQLDENQLDWGMDDIIGQEDDNEHNYNDSNADFTGGFEGGIPENDGGMGYEVDTNIVVPYSVWHPVPTPFNCSFCHVLREIIHENGTVSMKLEIHGRIGIICHVIHERQTKVNDGPPIVNHEMTDFTTQSIESVKQFLTQYCENRTREGFVLLQDPLTVYYNALCSGLNWFDNFHPDEPNLQPENPEAHHTQAEDANRTPTNANESRTPGNTNEARAPRTNLAIQRVRTKELTLGDLAKYFHLTLSEAAKELDLSITAIKKKCRAFGVLRWPQRTVNSVAGKISSLENRIREGNGNGNANSQIEALRTRLAGVYAVNAMNDDALRPNQQATG